MTTPETEQALRQEIADLRAKIEQVDDWANGIQKVLIEVLPSLLRGHPEVAKVRDQLQRYEARYEERLAHPDTSEGPGDVAGSYEAGMQLYRLLALLGVWPGVAPQEVAQKTLDRARRAKR